MLFCSLVGNGLSVHYFVVRPSAQKLNKRVAVAASALFCSKTE